VGADGVADLVLEVDGRGAEPVEHEAPEARLPLLVFLERRAVGQGEVAVGPSPQHLRALARVGVEEAGEVGGEAEAAAGGCAEGEGAAGGCAEVVASAPGSRFRATTSRRADYLGGRPVGLNPRPAAQVPARDPAPVLIEARVEPVEHGPGESFGRPGREALGDAGCRGGGHVVEHRAR